MDSLAFRIARSEDAAEILALGDRLTEGAATWRPPAEFRRAALGWLEESIQTMGPDHPMWVAEQSKQIVGVISAASRAHFTGQVDCYIGELVVSANCENRGIGRRLVAEVEAWAASRGVTRVTLETGAANDRARRFYESLGFREEQVQLTKVISDE